MQHLEDWANRRSGVEGEDLTEEVETPIRVDKAGVLYLHRDGVDYQCDECPMFIIDVQRCTIHQADEVILHYGGCGYWVPGTPITIADDEPHNLVSMIESGYVEDEDGFSCKRCALFLEVHDCRIVDPNSPGDDTGEIHPDACCAAWTAPS